MRDSRAHGLASARLGAWSGCGGFFSFFVTRWVNSLVGLSRRQATTRRSRQANSRPQTQSIQANSDTPNLSKRASFAGPFHCPYRRELDKVLNILKNLSIKKWALSLLGSAVLCPALASCGGGSERRDLGTYTVGGETYTVRAATTITTAKLPRPRLVARANALCREAWVEIRSDFSRFAEWPPRRDDRTPGFNQAGQVLLSSIDFYIFDGLHHLGAPAGEEEEVERMIGAMQLTVERGERLRISSIDQLIQDFDEFNQRARRYGLEDCLVDHSHLKFVGA